MKYLALLLLLVACVPPPDFPRHVEAQSPDGGHPDAHDSFPPPWDGPGDTCINDNAGQLEQSTCSDGLVCIPLSQENTTLTMCSKECAADSDCGTGRNGVPNACWRGMCWQGCSGFGGTCNGAGFNCQPWSSQGICQPDCTQEAASFCQEFFGYPFLKCDDDLRSSTFGSCGSAGDACGASTSCPADQVCLPVDGTDGGVSTCVSDCTTMAGTSCRANTDCVSDSCVNGQCEACPAGYACDGTSHACTITRVENYQRCHREGQCPDGVRCIDFGNDERLCLPTCQTDVACEANNPSAKCAFVLTDNSDVCAIDCSGDGGCPGGSACLDIQNLGPFCVPSN